MHEHGGGEDSDDEKVQLLASQRISTQSSFILSQAIRTREESELHRTVTSLVDDSKALRAKLDAERVALQAAEATVQQQNLKILHLLEELDNENAKMRTQELHVEGLEHENAALKEDLDRVNDELYKMRQASLQNTIRSFAKKAGVKKEVHDKLWDLLVDAEKRERAEMQEGWAWGYEQIACSSFESGELLHTLVVVNQEASNLSAAVAVERQKYAQERESDREALRRMEDAKRSKENDVLQLQQAITLHRTHSTVEEREAQRLREHLEEERQRCERQERTLAHYKAANHQYGLQRLRNLVLTEHAHRQAIELGNVGFRSRIAMKCAFLLQGKQFQQMFLTLSSGLSEAFRSQSVTSSTSNARAAVHSTRPVSRVLDGDERSPWCPVGMGHNYHLPTRSSSQALRHVSLRSRSPSSSSPSPLRDRQAAKALPEDSCVAISVDPTPPPSSGKMPTSKTLQRRRLEATVHDVPHTVEYMQRLLSELQAWGKQQNDSSDPTL